MTLGPLQIHWYGFMYLLAFGCAWLFGTRRAKRADNRLQPNAVADLIVYGAIGAMIGGRFGYMLFYNAEILASDPWSIVRIWEGGMSFHGGLLGVLIACYVYSKKIAVGFMEITDFIAPLVPLGLGFGRLGNFINTELPGRVTDVIWGLRYPCHAVRQFNPQCAALTQDGFEAVTRHPSSLYQAFAEGIVLMIIALVATRSARPIGFASGLFLLAYGVLRFLTEFFRTPDIQIGFLLQESITMGQLLSLPLVLAGIILLHWSSRKSPSA